jgi:hypothetical protein
VQRTSPLRDASRPLRDTSRTPYGMRREGASHLKDRVRGACAASGCAGGGLLSELVAVIMERGNRIEIPLHPLQPTDRRDRSDSS